jgi:polysaccharide deacetylase 2 family uncharacterized protein YibQ
LPGGDVIRQFRHRRDAAPMHEELTRPLGLAKHSPPSRFRLVGGGLALAAALVVAAIWGALSLRPHVGEGAAVPDPASKVPDITVTKKTALEGRDAADPVATGAIGNSKAASEDEAPDAAGDAAASGLQELQPDGAIVAKLPMPKPVRQEIALAHMPDPQLLEPGAFGAIPKRGADGRRPLDAYSREPATEGNFGVARVVLIVGGIGISQTGSQHAIRKLPAAVNLAFAPYGNSLSRWMQEARKSGHELLLQVPMQPYDWPQNSPGPNTLVTGVEAQENLANLHWTLSRITNYVGVMNYLGGKLLSDENALAPVFGDLAARGLAFVDDGSMANSRSGEAAGAARLPYARADLQIDSSRTRRDIAAKLDELVKQARRTGLAIGFANAFPETIEMLAQFAAGADKLGIEITPVSAVLRDPERGDKG